MLLNICCLRLLVKGLAGRRRDSPDLAFCARSWRAAGALAKRKPSGSRRAYSGWAAHHGEPRDEYEDFVFDTIKL